MGWREINLIKRNYFNRSGSLPGRLFSVRISSKDFDLDVQRISSAISEKQLINRRSSLGGLLLVRQLILAILGAL